MKCQARFIFVLLGAFAANSCLAEASPSAPGAYMGVFGGFGSLASTSLRQEGGFYLPGPLRHRIAVDANGDTASKHVALGGIQAGYEWNRWNLGHTKWGLKPALELEGIYIGKHSPVGDMPIEPHILGTQYVTMPMTAGVLLANAVFTFQTPYSNKIFPYLGVGAGIARMSIKGADSFNPNEPGINHFDSNPDASDSAFALQFKAGMKGEIARNLSLFAEYRRISVNATRYTFGETLPPHLPTDAWEVNLGRQAYNLFVAGVQYKF